MSETSSITAPLIEALNKTGGLALRMNSGVIRKAGRHIHLHKPGTADILFFPKADVANPSPFMWRWALAPVWLETKTLKGKTNREQVAAQLKFQDEVELLGHRYHKVKSVQEGLDAALKGAK